MISDNNHITYSAEDIQRYWNGQLTPQEMHAMEKAALDDPFLADAMEGMGHALQVHDEQQVNAALADMRRQLEMRTASQTRTAPVRSFRWWQVAAAAIVLIIAGLWIFSPDSENTSGGFVAQQETADAKEHEAITPNTTVAPAPRDSQAASGQAAAATPDSAIATVPDAPGQRRAKEPGLDQFTTSTQKNNSDTIYVSSLANSEAARNQAVLPPPVAELKKQKEEPPVISRPVPGHINSDTAFKGQTEVIKVERNFANLDKVSEKKAENEPKLQNVVSGVVTDTRNNPLPNVYIRLDSRVNLYDTDISNTYTTDRTGNFRIPITDSVVNVSVSLPGYNTQNFRLRSTHDGAGIASNQLKLEPADDQANLLNGYNSYSKKSAIKQRAAGPVSKVTEQDAQPVYGWLTYDQYLERNKRVPASNPNLIGEVAVSFVVNRKGETSDFRIEKSLSPDHDAEAIRLIRVGPGWQLKKGRKTRVTVIVRF